MIDDNTAHYKVQEAGELAHLCRRDAKVTKGVFVKRKRRRKSSQVEGQMGVFTLEGAGRQPKFQRPAGGAVSVTKV